MAGRTHPTNASLPARQNAQVQGWAAFLSILKNNGGKAAPWGGKWYVWKNGQVFQANPPGTTQATGDGGGGGGGYHGGGGGGGSSEDPKLQFVNYYKYIGRPVNAKLVARAVKEKVTLDVFEGWVMKFDTKSYVLSWKGQDDLYNFRQEVHAWFPNLDNKGTKMPAAQVKKWFWQFTKNRLNYTNFGEFVKTTKLYKDQYKARGFEQALPEYQNPEQFRQVSALYAGLKRTMLNEEATTTDFNTFFSHKILLDQFKTNIEALSQGAGAYEWATQGEKLGVGEVHNLLYGDAGGATAQQKLARAYQARQSFFNAREASAQASLNEQGEFVQQGAF